MGELLHCDTHLMPRVFLDVTIDGVDIGRIKIELYDADVPKAAENFRALCAGDVSRHKAGLSGDGKLSFKGSCFHRVMEGFAIQGGDIIRGDGSDGWSIFGRTFPDEQIAHQSRTRQTHAKAGTVSVVGLGAAHTNSSQFIITTSPARHLDGAYIVVGHVFDGLDVARQVERLPVDLRDRPHAEVRVIDCGML